MPPEARYAVFGNPIAHSRSPQIHLAFARQEGAHIAYDKILLPKDGFADGAAAAFAGGLSGANVTVPFKLDAFAFAFDVSERAKIAGAVNTLIVGEDGIRGDNSDGLGLMHDIRHQYGVDLRGLSVLVLGAGGAVRGVLQPLLDLQPASVAIANRTPEKARLLAEQFGIEALSLQDASQKCYDVVINGTASGLSDEAPDIAAACFAECRLAYDMVYAAEPTAFMRLAKQGGAAQAADGLGMLVGQAAVSYQWWRGFAPETQTVLTELRNALSCSDH